MKNAYCLHSTPLDPVGEATTRTTTTTMMMMMILVSLSLSLSCFPLRFAPWSEDPENELSPVVDWPRLDARLEAPPSLLQPPLGAMRNVFVLLDRTNIQEAHLDRFEWRKSRARFHWEKKIPPKFSHVVHYLPI